MRTETTSPFLTTQEAARYLRLRPSTLARWRSVGGGPPFRKFGGRVVYSREELEEYAEAGRRVSTSDSGASAR
ncbi:MAG: helix-turn-helix domain-containing protein [bacterium]|nr:helix-turn-helix domain-containing protein [bacterium]